MTDEQIIKREIEKADEEWWNSHGRATSTFNSQGTGKDWQ